MRREPPAPLPGSVWEDTIVGFLCAAGGEASYMSVMAYANSLILDFRCAHPLETIHEKVLSASDKIANFIQTFCRSFT